MFVSVLSAMMLTTHESSAQVGDTPRYEYKSYSIDTIRMDDVMYSITLWRDMYFDEKINQPYVSKGFDIRKEILNGLLSGQLPLYAVPQLGEEPFEVQDQFNTKYRTYYMPKDLDFKEFVSTILRYSGTTQSLANQVLVSSILGPDSTIVLSEADVKDILTLTFTEFFKIEIQEDFIVDAKHSRAKFDMNFITVYFTDIADGSSNAICRIPYQDFYEYFQDNKNAKWINPQNRAKNLSVTDAFALRLFGSFITKYSNPDDQGIVELVQGDVQFEIDNITQRLGRDDIKAEEREKLEKQLENLRSAGLQRARIASRQFEQKLLELEATLWEY